jgi:hypothetical protein
MKSNSAIGFALMVVLSTVPGIILGTENVLSSVEDEGLVSHDPILIVGDVDFTQENGVTSGSGTESNPYIIENYRIESDGYGISLTDTSAIFIIRG